MRKALCIGVSAQSSSTLKPLAQCRNDVSQFSSFCSSPAANFEVTELLDPESNSLSHNVWHQIVTLGRDDTLLLYFTGHGRRSRTSKLHLCTIETEIPDLVVTSVSFEALLDMIRNAGIGSVLIILDCCFSGAAKTALMTKGELDPIGPHEEAIAETKGLAVLSSVGPFDTAHVSEGADCSDFTDSLLEVCREHVQNEETPLYIGDVHKQLLKRGCDGVQPQLFGDNYLFPLCLGRPEESAEVLARPEDVFRIVLHEAGQQLAGLEWLVESYFRRADRISELPPHRVKQIGDELYAGIRSMSLILRAPNLMTADKIPIRKRVFSLRGAAMHVQMLLKADWAVKGIRFKVRDERPDTPVKCYADDEVVEVALFEVYRVIARYALRNSYVEVRAHYEPDTQRTAVLEIVYLGIGPANDIAIGSCGHQQDGRNWGVSGSLSTEMLGKLLRLNEGRLTVTTLRKRSGEQGRDRSTASRLYGDESAKLIRVALFLPGEPSE